MCFERTQIQGFIKKEDERKSLSFSSLSIIIISLTRLQRLSEFGIIEKLFSDVPAKFTNDQSIILLETRISKQVMTPESQLSYLKLKNTKNVWIIIGSMICFSVIILRIEIFHANHLKEWTARPRVARIRIAKSTVVPAITAPSQKPRLACEEKAPVKRKIQIRIHPISLLFQKRKLTKVIKKD